MAGQRYLGVIGANFGDEGKGRFVDYLASQSEKTPLIIRHNSGAQAGHTVQIGDRRHVHHHFGSGTLRGCPTLLGPKFVINPLAFNEEWETLKALGVFPHIYSSPDCVVSTPLDMLLNQLQEEARGDARHGSCGMGFGETIQRRITHPALFWNYYDQLENYFLDQVQIRDIAPNEGSRYYEVYKSVCVGSFRWDLFEAEMDKFEKRCSVLQQKDMQHLVRANNHQLIFEGAQGLALHEDHEFSPHVTWCRTGAEDIVEFLDHFNCYGELELVYVTRPYLTRHGAGPFPTENPSLSFEDKTNVPNDWQGSLRFGDSDASFTQKLVRNDILRSERLTSRRITSYSAVSCADQGYPNDPAILHSARYVGWGPDSKDTREYK